jgi:hypothetical protein
VCIEVEKDKLSHKDTEPYDHSSTAAENEAIHLDQKIIKTNEKV